MLFEVRRLIKGRKDLLCAGKHQSVADALALMVANDYSQLPIANSDGTLAGVISEQSIVHTYFHSRGVSLLDLRVDHCMEPAQTIGAGEDIFILLGKLEAAYAVVVVEGNKPTGIVTNYDTTRFFRELSGGLILVEDIEVTLRRHYIERAFDGDHARQAALVRAFGVDRRDPSSPARQYDDLSFHEHIQLMISGENWDRFAGTLEPKPLFQSYMEQVGEIRNQLAHFRGDLTPPQVSLLNTVRGWLASRPGLPLAAGKAKAELGRSTDETTAPEKAGYASLQRWLAETPDRVALVETDIDTVARLVGDDFPELARKHPSWWSNDPFGESHALGWLRAGWRVHGVNLESGEVAFQRERSVLMQLFFADLLERLKQAHPGITGATRTQPQSWFSFGAGRTGFTFGWAFARGSAIQVELYIDTGDKQRNKSIYDRFYSEKQAIEEDIENALNWERLDNKRASRIAIARTGSITDSAERLEEHKLWMLETMLRFVDVLRPRIRRLEE